MKNILGMMSFLMASSVFANGPVLVKTQASGFTPIEWRSSLRCEIFLDHVEITADFGKNSVALSKTMTVSIDASIQALIADAKQETFVSDSTLCDAGSTEIFAMDYSGLLPSQVALYAFSTCDLDGERNGPASFHLRKIVDMLCD